MPGGKAALRWVVQLPPLQTEAASNHSLAIYPPDVAEYTETSYHGAVPGDLFSHVKLGSGAMPAPDGAVKSGSTGCLAALVSSQSVLLDT